jgi:outer membrane protein TolC
MKIIRYVALLLVTVPTCAQTLKLTQQQAIDTGLQRRFDVRANKYNIQLAVTAITDTKYKRLPSLRGDASITYHPQIQTTAVPGGVLPGYEHPALVALGSKHVSTFGLSLDVPLYQPGNRNDISIARNALALQQEKNKGDEILIKRQIAQAYLNLLLKGLQRSIAADEEARNKMYYELAAGKYQHGALIENEYLRVKLDYENAKVLSTEMTQQYDLAMQALRYQLNLPPSAVIAPADQLDAPAMTIPENVRERTELRQLQIALDGNALALRKARQQVLPVVALTANYSQQYLNEKLGYRDSRWWSPFSYVGVKISVPISAHFTNRTAVTMVQQQMAQQRLLIAQTNADISYEVQQAYTTLRNAELNMQTTRDNYTLSGKIYQNQQQQFKLGMFQYRDLLDTARSLSQAERQYVEAVYAYLMAKIAYQEAVGIL